MSEAQAAFNDEELTAFLDGEADAALASQIEAALRTDPLLQQRFQALDIPLAALQEGFSTQSLQAPALPTGLLPEPQKTQAPMQMVAGFALAFGLGALSVFMLQPGAEPVKAPGWKAVVASYQSLYTAETVAGAAQPLEVTTKVLAEFGSTHSVDLVPAQSVEGLEFKRAQLLGFKGKPLLQMAYIGPDGAPIAFCVTRSNGDNSAMQSESLAGMAAASWVENGVGYLVIGGQDQGFVDAVAADIRGRLG
ncbi:hypothetical protein RSK20926_08317 [Roseobacter sp. SK209-2-6]|uniref:anti-sigma factor family protein n=1 Tax=Roseobacter sp. SK209-2-6 TaxID=388739 RepID=UPI0000F3D230|nr:hypothetical protein [Roseobacter sp. SK209-2-6]EBA16959.1 hypothetical protein RSK20926_08317 [Roseobacter sp. SK209-2-6]